MVPRVETPVEEQSDDPRVQDFLTLLFRTYVKGDTDGFSPQGKEQVIGDFLSSVGETARPDTSGAVRTLRKAPAEEFGLFAHKHDLPILELADDPEFGFIEGGESFSREHHLALVCIAGPAEDALAEKNSFQDAFDSATIEGSRER